jgi:hypothetical protein
MAEATPAAEMPGVGFSTALLLLLLLLPLMLLLALPLLKLLKLPLMLLLLEAFDSSIARIELTREFTALGGEQCGLSPS